MGKAGKGASKGRWSKQTPIRSRGALNHIAFVPSPSNGLPREDLVSADDQSIAHFSLEQEAQNTERRQTWNTDLKLRHARVAFVSAVHSTTEDPTVPTQGPLGATSEMQGHPFKADEVLQGEAMAHLHIHDSPIRDIPMLTAKKNTDGGLLLAAERMNDLTSDTSSVNLDNKMFFIDTRGTREPIGTKLSASAARRSQSPDMSDSSNEMIVFSGRGRVGANSGAANSGANHASSPVVENIHQHFNSSSHRAVKVIDDPVFPSTSSTPMNQGYHPAPNLFPKGLDSLPDITTKLLSNPHKGSTVKHRLRERANEEVILADYVANITDNDLQKHNANHGLNITRELGGMDDPTDNLPDETTIRNAWKSDTNWDLSDLADLEDIITSGEDLATVGRVLSKRKRGLGVHYLVAEGGHTVDKARWVPLSSLVHPGAEKHISIYETRLSSPEEYMTHSEGSDDNISSHQLRLDLPKEKDMENLLGEHKLLSRRKERAKNVKSARMLSEQEGQGLGSSNLLVYDGDEDGNDDSFLPSRKGEYTSVLRSRGKKNRLSKHIPPKTAFTRALIADAHDDVDIVDQGRSNLRKKSEARRGIPGLELTDTELENSIQLAWENDRAKKKFRKQEREELRAHGLLGKKKKPDSKSNCGEGMSIADIKNDIEVFLVSSVQSMPLPAMGHRDRKMVHEIANVLGLKSKSIGSGSSRFPVLYRTSRTVAYDEKAIKSLEAQMNGKRFLPRRDRVLGKSSATLPKVRGRGFNNAAVSYRDGEIVGAAAPELGQENKGRAMLEKMGWSTGTALGALNNKGIIQPLAHVVKTTKAGLG